MSPLSDVFRSVPADCKEPDISSMKEVPETHLWPHAPDEEQAEPYSTNGVPVIDLNGIWHEQGEEAARVVQQVGGACEEYGVFQILNHGISHQLLEKVEMQGRRLFSLPLNQKLKARRTPDGVTGYGMARISMFFNKLMWSEGFTSIGSPSDYAKKLWPNDYHQFCKVMEEYEHAMKELAVKVMSLVVQSLGLSGGDYRWCDYETCGALQMNHYPSCPQPSQTMGMAAHTDSTLVTILYQGNVEGLHIQRNGKWMVVPALPNAFVVNLGDLMQVLSNGRYKSVLHRAMVNKTRQRLSFAYLWGPPLSAVVKPAPKLVDSKHPLLYKSLTWNEYLIAKAKYFNNAPQLFALSYVQGEGGDY